MNMFYQFIEVLDMISPQFCLIEDNKKFKRGKHRSSKIASSHFSRMSTVRLRTDARVT